MLPKMPFTLRFPFESEAAQRGMAWEGVSAEWRSFGSTPWPCGYAGCRPGLGLLQDTVHSMRSRTAVPQPSVQYSCAQRLTVENNHVQQQAFTQSALKSREKYYSLQWALDEANAKETELILTINKEVVFLSCLWLILSFTCDSLLLSPVRGLAREPQRYQLIRNRIWMKRITFMFSTSPCFVWALKTTMIPNPFSCPNPAKTCTINFAGSCLSVLDSIGTQNSCTSLCMFGTLSAHSSINSNN